MHIDPSAVLALLSDLTQRLAASEAENAQLRAKMETAPTLEREGFKAYATPDGTYAVSWGGQWLSGIYGKTAEEAIELGRAEVAKG
jgi:hypothetical protein